MKIFTTTLALAVAALVIIGFGGTGYAFHSGGVAECEGCHTMHNSHNGEVMNPVNPLYVAGPYLLTGSDQSSACLNCHGPNSTGSYHILSTYATGSGPSNITPGGDFGWLMKDYTWVGPGSTVNNSEGYKHGHNIVAADYGIPADGRFTVAPGGSYPQNKFYCSSCHDPHSKARVLSSGAVANTGEPIRSSGSYGANPTTINGVGYAVGMYRLLGGMNYLPDSIASTGLSFNYDAMRAAVKSGYNASEATTQTRVAYGYSSSEWCANCHQQMHSLEGVGNYVHPTGTPLGSGIVANYNAYVSSGKMTGSKATAFLSLVPFQSDNYGAPGAGSATANSTLFAISNTTVGAEDSDRTTCLSCHRSHASGWDSMLRFPYGYEFMTGLNAANEVKYTYAVRSAMGRNEAEFSRALGDRPATLFGAYQRVLCNKCHAKD